MKLALPVITHDTNSGIIAAANNEEILHALAAGRISAAANDNNLTGFVLSQPLTEFLSGSGIEERDNLQQILDRAFPSVPVGDAFTYLNEDETAQGLAPSSVEIKRAIGGDFVEDRPKGTQTADQLDHYGLAMWLDVRQGGNNPRVQQHYAQVLRNRLLRGQFVEGITLLEAAASADTSKNWNDSDADPDSDLDEMLDTAGDVSGANPNRVLYGGGAWLKRRRAYRKATRTNGGDGARMTPEQLAAEANVEDVIVANVRKRSSATALTKILNNTVIVYEADGLMTPTDPSNIKRFTGMGLFGQFQVFVDNSSPVRTKVVVHTMAKLKITRTIGIRKRAITFS